MRTFALVILLGFSQAGLLAQQKTHSVDTLVLPAGTKIPLTMKSTVKARSTKP